MALSRIKTHGRITHGRMTHGRMTHGRKTHGRKTHGRMDNQIYCSVECHSTKCRSDERSGAPPKRLLNNFIIERFKSAKPGTAK
jgi:hypothetical protein